MQIDSIITSISIGLLATTSPCVLPMYPGYLAYISGGQEGMQNKFGRYLLGFFVLMGVLVTMLVLGGIIALLSISVGRALSVVIPVADLLIIFLGVLLLLDKNPFKRLPQIQVPVLNHPYMNAFIYGVLYGPIALPCAGPLVVSIFALSLTTGQMLAQLGIFFWFGIGFGLPLLVLSFLSGAAASWITREFARRSRQINLVSGVLLIGIGIFDLIANWELIRAFF